MSLLTVILISVSCHRASVQVEVRRQEAQTVLVANPLRQDTRQQQKLLLQQVSACRVVFTACDFFTIKKTTWKTCA